MQKLNCEQHLKWINRKVKTGTPPRFYFCTSAMTLAVFIDLFCLSLWLHTFVWLYGRNVWITAVQVFCICNEDKKQKQKRERKAKTRSREVNADVIFPVHWFFKWFVSHFLCVCALGLFPEDFFNVKKYCVLASDLKLRVQVKCKLNFYQFDIENHD